MPKATPLFLLLVLASYTSAANAADDVDAIGTPSYKDQVIQVDERLQALTKLNLDAFPEVKKLIEQNRTAEAIRCLDQLLPQFENDAHYFNLLGVLHLHQKSYANAAAAFERVVLIQSDNAGAWLDLALANAEAGNFAMARQYFDYIEQELSPPPNVTRLIVQSRTKMKVAEAGPRHWSGKIEAMMGYDSNANSGLLEKNIVVTFQGGKLEIPIDASYAARPDSFRHVALQGSYQKQSGSQSFFWNTNAASHHFTNEHRFSHYDLSSNVGLVHRANAIDMGAAFSVEHLVLGKQSLLNNQNFSVFFEKNNGHCQVNLAFEHEWRRYHSTTILNGDTVWKNLALACTASFQAGSLQNTLLIRHGTDRPLKVRPGGVANRREAIFKSAWRNTRAFRIELSFHLAQSHDQEGYSPLLENNAKREVLRKGYQMQMIYPTAYRWNLLANWSYNTSLSNLALFKQKNNVFSLGVQRQF